MIRDDLADHLRLALDACGVAAPEHIALERPTRLEHGDWSSNVVMVVAKPNDRNPRELAQEVVTHLTENLPFHVESVEVAGPGFVNFRLAPSWLHQVLDEVVTQGTADYARHHVGNGVHVNVEFVSANPTGPVHAGHARGAAYGDSLARILERIGHEVSREFYINDRGVQMEAFAASLAARRRGEEPPEGGYQGQYITDWAALMPVDADPLEWGYAHALEDQREVLNTFNVHFDTWFSERSMVDSGAIEADVGRPARARGGLRAGRRHLAAQHRPRRRQGPGADQVRRPAHLPAARHRLPPRQVRPRRPAHRRVGSRPPRLRRPA